MVTRRCTQRQFLLRPSVVTNSHFEYCLAVAAQRSGVKVLAFLVMSNHYHAVVRDPDAKLPLFLEHLNKLLARSLNAHYGRWENFWSSEACCATHLVTKSDVLEKILYVLGNPVTDHLVERVHHWPGSHSYGAMLTGTPIETKRPRGFFREEGPMPLTAPLSVERPPGFEGYEHEAWAAFLASRVTAIEASTRNERLHQGTRLLGRKAVLRASASDHPTTSAPHRNLRPNIACKDTAKRILAIAQLKAFRRAYFDARQRVLFGIESVMFPFGTYRLRLLGMRCPCFPTAGAS